MLTYAFAVWLSAFSFSSGYLVAMLRRARRERGLPPPPAFTLASRVIGTNTAAPTAAGFSSTVTLGDPLAGQVWPVTLREPSRPAAPTGYGELEGGNRGNGLLPYAGSDD